jgi:aminoglycoside phosphotransferase (APT) family kinase protein
MADLLDQPRAVRPGEELDPARLTAYLATAAPDLGGPIEVRQFPQGYSNLTYLLRIGGREVVLRRPPFGVGKSSAHDMGREYRTLAGVARVYPLVPRPLVYCADETVLGAPFYLMERVPGLILRTRPPAGLDLPPPTMRRLAEVTIDNLAAIHALDYQAAGLGDLGHPAGYAGRQVQGWTARYARARTDDIPDIEQAATWLAEHIPPDADAGAALLHNDYKYDNLVLDPADLPRIRAVLDWEMATIGDPLMDLGTTLGYWVQADDAPELQAMRFGPTTLPGNLTRAELVQRYAQASGRDVTGIGFYYVYGLFKIAVIAQQIYARYRQGYTHDARFAGLLPAIQALGRAAAQAIASGRLAGRDD